MNDPTWPATKCAAVTTSDTVNFTAAVRMIYVGTGGNITVVNSDDTTVLFKNVMASTSIGPFFIKRVNATGTTATDLVAFY